MNVRKNSDCLRTFVRKRLLSATTTLQPLHKECVVDMKRETGDNQIEANDKLLKINNERRKKKKNRSIHQSFNNDNMRRSRMAEPTPLDDDNEKTHIKNFVDLLSIFYTFSFSILFTTFYLFIAVSYLFSFIKKLFKARLKNLNIILTTYLIFLVILFYDTSPLLPNNGIDNHNFTITSNIYNAKEINNLYDRPFYKTMAGVFTNFDQVVIYNQNINTSKANMTLSSLLANIIVPIAFIIKNYNRKTKVFFHFSIATIFVITMNLKTSHHSFYNYKRLKVHPKNEFFTITI